MAGFIHSNLEVLTRICLLSASKASWAALEASFAHQTLPVGPQAPASARAASSLEERARG